MPVSYTHLDVYKRQRLIRGLLQEAGAQLRDLKLSRQVISFNDMLSNVHERLMHSGHAGLAASIEQRFPAALIDEFQDTDPLQFDIFRRIYAGGEMCIRDRCDYEQTLDSHGPGATSKQP